VRDGLTAKQSAAIRGMFGRIAARYDLVNRLLSLGLDRSWRRRVVRRVVGARPRRVLDVCTGTGDLALAFPAAAITFGSDFSLPMLIRAQVKARRRHRPLSLFAADALRMPIQDHSMDVATVAFGIRNFEDLSKGLRELARVLRPGGTLLVLEFSRPRGPFAAILRWWMHHVPQWLGGLVSGDREAYGYLSASVASFPSGEEMCRMLAAAGVAPARVHRLTGGVATMYEAVKPSDEGVIR
jgi:demethylmenaquinone methyltransferase/2-methoxy-6-polyprenyl-1,4-benzoquinol methylase